MNNKTFNVLVSRKAAKQTAYTKAVNVLNTSVRKPWTPPIVRSSDKGFICGVYCRDTD